MRAIFLRRTAAKNGAKTTAPPADGRRVFSSRRRYKKKCARIKKKNEYRVEFPTCIGHANRDPKHVRENSSLSGTIFVGSGIQPRSFGKPNLLGTFIFFFFHFIRKSVSRPTHTYPPPNLAERRKPIRQRVVHGAATTIIHVYDVLFVSDTILMAREEVVSVVAPYART